MVIIQWRNQTPPPLGVKSQHHQRGANGHYEPPGGIPYEGWNITCAVL